LVFEAQKKRALERLRIRGADEEVGEILDKINSLDGFFTTSSCSGRIILICLPEICAKQEARFKYSGIKAIAKDNGKVMVDIMSTERMGVPLASDDVMFCSEAYRDFIPLKANFTLERGKDKLKRFGYVLKELE